MASKRAKKHRETVKAQRELKQIQRDINRANQRLSELETSGQKNVIYTTTTNALGDRRFKRVKNVEQAREQKRILNKFLSSKTSTAQGARAASSKNRADFAEFLRRATGGKMSDNMINLVAARMGDLNLGELIKSYVYNEIRDMVIDIENSGISATADNVTRGLSTSIDNVIIDELQRRGVQIPAEITEEALMEARTNNIDVAIDFIEEYKRKQEEQKRGSENDDKS